MAQTTPNFGFNIAEGTDTVNLLTQCYPNFTSLDSILQTIKESGVTTAVATKTGTNFAVVRTDTDCNFFRFIATANYAAGDTFTVDGVAVTATTPAGTALPAGAFVINQSVIAVLNSAVLTLFVGGGASTIDAEDVDYDNSGSGLTATDVQAAIDEVVAVISGGIDASDVDYDNSGSGLTATNVQDAIDEMAASAPVGPTLIATANANQTNATQLTQLQTAFAALSDDKKARAYIVNGTGIYKIDEISSGRFSRIYVQSSSITIIALSIGDATKRVAVSGNPWTFTDQSSSNDTNTMELWA